MITQHMKTRMGTCMTAYFTCKILKGKGSELDGSVCIVLVLQ